MINTHNIPMNIESLKFAARCTRGLNSEIIVQITYDESTGMFRAFQHTDSCSYVETKAITVLRTRRRVTIQQLADATAKAVEEEEIRRNWLASFDE